MGNKLTNTLSRLARHLCTTTGAARRMFPAHTLKAIQKAITEGEKLHRAEVRLIVEPALGIQDVIAGCSPRARAKELFAIHGVWDTEENCGVLIYINVADRQVEIVADRGIGKVISDKQWKALCLRMTHGFAHGDVHDSLLDALWQLQELLEEHYPDQKNSANELPDAPLII